MGDARCEGDSVVVLPMDPCGRCEPCRRGQIQLCQEGLSTSNGLGAHSGGFAQYMVVRSSMVCRLPDGLDLRTGALTEPWAVAIRGVNLSGIRIGEDAVVMGAGPIGLLCIYALRIAGAGKVLVSEPDRWRAERASAAGADGVFDPAGGDVAAEVRRAAGRPPEVVLDCAGTAGSLEEAAAIAGTQGRIVALGIHPGTAGLFPLNWFLKEVLLRFSFGYTRREFEAALTWLARGAVDAENVVSGVVPLTEADRALKDLHGPGHMKVLLDCRA